MSADRPPQPSPPGWCPWCGHPVRYQLGRGDSAGDSYLAHCPNCGRPVGIHQPAGTGHSCDQCGEGLAARERYCPQCGVANIEELSDPAIESSTAETAALEWKTSDWYGQGSGGQAPPCPDCGAPVRGPDSLRPEGFPGYANPPWNAGWLGNCENCGADFDFVANRNGLRRLHVRPANRLYWSLDTGTAVSGVEVTVTDKQFRGQPSSTNTVFVSMAELTALYDQLHRRLALYVNQYDWASDWT